MKEFSPEELKQMLEDLSYSFSQPEADHFRRLTQEGKSRTARNMLIKEGFDEDSAKAIYQHYRTVLKGYDLTWREITADEAIALGSEKGTIDLLIRKHNSVFQYPLYERYNGEWSVCFDYDFISIKDVDQIWVGEPKQ